MAVCATCGAQAPEGARFCPECGAALVSGRETRKVVTVLFCDWVGSTTIGERLDAESLRHLQESFFAEARTVLERHGGTVEKFIGDAVMCVFGIPQAHEDDALRAVRAAVDLRAALAALNERLQRGQGVRLSVRTAVNTGEVLAGDPSEGEAFVTGGAVVVTKRLEEAAAAGEILIGEPTRLLVRNAAVVEPVEGLALKGTSTATAWRLLGVLPGAPGFARRLDVALVGRELELTLLRQAFERAAIDGTGHFVTVLGPAGVGKSRLVNELLADVGDRATALRGSCLPYGEGITFWPFVRVVRDAARIARDLPADAAKLRIAELAADDADAATIAERVAGAIGLSESPGSPEETFWAIRRLLESLARRRPVVLALDDVHWGEETFLELVEYLGDWTRDSPILLVCLARPELLDARPAWGGGKVNATSIMLDPLSSDESGRLIENLLGAHEVDEETKRAIVGMAEGNPLFLEEILVMLVDEGTLRQENGTWRIDDARAVRVPATIQALLAARLDRLEPEERAVVETAAVMGTWFRQAGLAELSGDDTLPTRLERLVRKELIRPAPERSGEPAFRFRHVLIRDAAYRSIPKERRAALHERFAGWAQRSYGERAREVEEIIGYHLEQAYRTRAELGRDDAALAVRASAVLASAGRRALVRGDAPAARNLIQRAVDLPGTELRERLGRLLDLARALRESGELTAAERLLETAPDDAITTGDRRLEAQILVERCYLRFFTDPKGWMEEALSTADRAIEILDELGDDAGLADAWILVVLFHYSRCRIGEMETALDPALFHATRAGNPRQLSTLMNLMTRAALVGPMPVEAAIARCDAIAADRPRDRSLEAVTAGVRAYLEAMRGRFDEARALYARSQTVLHELGQYRLLAAMRPYNGSVELLAGDPVAAERELRAGAVALEAIGDRGNLASLAPQLAQALDANGRETEAVVYIALGEDMASPQDVTAQVSWRLARARLEAKREHLDAAERVAREATALAAETDCTNMKGDTRLCLGEILAARGRRDEAEAAIRSALRHYEAKGNVVAAGQARAALDRVALEV